MEILISAITFTMLIVLIVCPVFILNKLYQRNSKNIFISYFILVTIVTFLFILVIAWWSHFSSKLLLSHYGYDFNAMNEVESFKNVELENLDKAKKTEISMMGIGWPLKAYMSYPIYFPYILIVYFGFYFYKRNRLKSN
jgi:hypothetical protein